MADSYKEFDKAPIVDTSDVVIKGFRFRVREAVLGIAVLVCLLVIIILAALLGTANNEGNNSASTSALTSDNKSCMNQCFTPPCLKTAAHVMELISPNNKPCDDFHTFACGNFPQLYPLRPYEREMTTFQVIYDRNQQRLRRLLEQNLDPQNDLPQNYERKMRDFFASCQDHWMKMQKQGRPFLDQIVKPSGGWWALKGDTQWAGVNYNFNQQLKLVHVDFWTDAFFTFGLITDWMNWNKRTIQIDLSGMGLPYTYFYEPTLRGFLDDYKNYIRNVTSLLLRDSGLSLADGERDYRIDTVVQDAFFVESELAKLKNRSKATEDPHALGNRMKLSDLNTLSAGAVNWVDLFTYMFRQAGVTADTSVVVLEKEYIQKFSQWLNNLPSANKSRILNNYLIWRLADHYDQDLSWDYIHANRKINVDLTGRAEFLGTWRYCVYKLDRDMKEALGALFVQNHFSQQNKMTAHTITDYVKEALVDGLRNSPWMSNSTKKNAEQKINDSIMQLGYPELLTDTNKLNRFYANLKIGDDYMQNVLSFNKFYREQWNNWLIQANNRTIWPYAAYDFVAHYYSPWKEMFVPAGLLQFPIYDHSSPRYTNFGSMGTIVGRQLTHAVDEYGNSYKLNGAGPGNWWSSETTDRYKNVKKCMIDALDGITMGNQKIPLNAEVYSPLALAESSSVRLAYMAYHKWVNTTGGEKNMPGGTYSNDQMFFISFAQTYCRTRDPEREMIRVNNGRTPTEKIRVNSALAHVPEFQAAFQCSSPSKMVAPKRCNFF